MPRFTQAQLDRKARRRGFPLDDSRSELPHAEHLETEPEPASEPEPPAPEPAVVPEDATSTAKALLAWMDDAPTDDEHLARAEAARAVNDERAKPWKSVSTAVDGILS